MPEDVVHFRVMYPKSALVVKSAFAGMFSCVPTKEAGWKASKYECTCFNLGLYWYKDGCL